MISGIISILLKMYCFYNGGPVKTQRFKHDNYSLIHEKFNCLSMSDCVFRYSYYLSLLFSILCYFPKCWPTINVLGHAFFTWNIKSLYIFSHSHGSLFINFIWIFLCPLMIFCKEIKILLQLMKFWKALSLCDHYRWTLSTKVLNY